jgi:uncharacterized membrane protein YkoI
MLRPSASPRLLVGLSLAAALGAGVGLGVAGLGSSSGTTTRLTDHTQTAEATTAAAPGPIAVSKPASAPLSVEQAKAVALQASPGTVIEVHQDNQAGEPSEAADAPEATDPADSTEPAGPNEATELTGPQYEVTVLHSDGTATEVVVDAAIGRVVDTTQEDDWNGN